MAHERGDRTSLPSELKYRVVGTGPRAEAQHGRYIRSILRYLEAHKPTQWLIATEAISRPHAPSDDGQNARTPRMGGDGPPHSDSSGESGNTSDTSDTTDTGRDEPDQLESLRARLFGAGDNYDATENGTRGRTPIPTGEANTALGPGDGTIHAPDAIPADEKESAADEIQQDGDARTANSRAAQLTKTQLAAQRSSRRTQNRDSQGRFVKEEHPADVGVNESRPTDVDTGPTLAGTTLSNDGTAAAEAAFNAGRQHERDAAQATLARQIDILVEARKRNRASKQRRRRRKRSPRTPSLAKTLKVVRTLATTLHTSEQFNELTYTLQRELYDYSNARLYAFLMRSLGEEYAHIIPDESAGGPAHADGLRCWRVARPASPPRRAKRFERGILAWRIHASTVRVHGHKTLGSEHPHLHAQTAGA